MASKGEGQQPIPCLQITGYVRRLNICRTVVRDISPESHCITLKVQHDWCRVWIKFVKAQFNTFAYFRHYLFGGIPSRVPMVEFSLLNLDDKYQNPFPTTLLIAEFLKKYFGPDDPETLQSMTLYRRFGSSPTEMPINFQNDRTILKQTYLKSRLCKIQKPVRIPCGTSHNAVVWCIDDSIPTQHPLCYSTHYDWWPFPF